MEKTTIMARVLSFLKMHFSRVNLKIISLMVMGDMFTIVVGHMKGNSEMETITAQDHY